MASCRDVDPLVTPYVDGEISAADKAMIEAHLVACPRCRDRAEAEASARTALRTRCCQPCAPEHLRKRCAKVSTPMGRMVSRYPLSSFSLGAALFAILGGATVYGLTRVSPGVLAAQLALDHIKCFAFHGDAEPLDPRAAEDEFARRNGWRMHVLEAPAAEGLQLIGVRRCFCGEGPAVHVMYRHRGEPVSLYVLPRVSRSAASTEAFGHDAVIWTKLDTTYVLLGREPDDSLERLAANLR